MSKPMTNAELKEAVVKMAEANHIWINAFNIIKPSDDTLIALGRVIVQMLHREADLLPSFHGSVEGDVSELQRLSPTLYLSINAS